MQIRLDIQIRFKLDKRQLITLLALDNSPRHIDTPRHADSIEAPKKTTGNFTCSRQFIYPKKKETERILKTSINMSNSPKLECKSNSNVQQTFLENELSRP
ncbi:hypothetical protein AVEN_98917-1 [Araneus ventricosus]|uniref:Uncharacterized protein n=1 Tax=Araneus ventricosus TaxID=182803 RepID=A0A4Y2H0G2_ARAVE|nr:hypothetical protein AVEN_98917-1 [Araneus ventricosus]